MMGLAMASTSFCFSVYSSLSASGFSSSQSSASLIVFSISSLSSADSLSATPFSSSSSVFFMLYRYDSRPFRASMRSLTFLSSSAYSSASRTMRSMSSSDSRPFSAVIVIFSALPVPLSSADTCRMPFASISNVTSICGTPRGAGGMDVSSNLPRRWLSFVMDRSPSKTWISTPGWLSAYVENVCDFLAGTVVLRLMSAVMTPPAVSRPSDSGVTSRRSRSESFSDESAPERMAAWTVAPNATASSGLMR
mmetsp:Transcript_27246/g.83987  ORF Transcript_27246/g.83987 Transcript_27246/m.83987 type:complete len:250 (+) Transcript_27246:136-885(+)